MQILQSKTHWRCGVCFFDSNTRNFILSHIAVSLFFRNTPLVVIFKAYIYTMKNYDWYLFDLDNTVLDFSEVSKTAFSHLVTDFDLDSFKSTYAIYSKINKGYWERYENGMISAEQLKRGRFEDFINTLKLDADPDFLSKRYFELILEHSKEIDGALKALEYFKNKGKLALITNGLSDVQHHRLSKHNLEKHFEHLFISDEMKVSKPSALFFDKVHQQIGAPKKENVLVLGDNPISDIQGGKDFGFDTFFYNYRKNRNHNIKSNYSVSDWKEVF